MPSTILCYNEILVDRLCVWHCSVLKDSTMEDTSNFGPPNITSNGSIKCVPGSFVEVIPIDPRIVENQTAASTGTVYPDWERAMKITFYTFSFIMAVCGNSMVILTILLNKKMKTTTNCLILNLAVSDLLIGLLCMWVHLGSQIEPEWPFGSVVCKMKHFVQVIVVTSSTLTLMVISADRLVAIVFPLRSRLSPLLTGMVIGLTWLISIGTALPQLIVMEQKELFWKNRHEVWCEESWPRVYVNEDCDVTEPGRKVYYTVYVVVIYFLSVVFMVAAYSLIMVTIVTRKLPGAVTDSIVAAQDKSKRKVVRMLVAVVITFIVCWTPQQSLLLWQVYRVPGEYPHYIDGLKYAALYIAYSNSSINPLLYGGLNEHFRRSFIHICHCTRLRNRNRVAPESIPGVVETHAETDHVQTNL